MASWRNCPCCGRVHLDDGDKDLLRLVAQDYRYTEISAELFLAEQTIKNRICRLLRKFEVHSTAALLAKLLSVGALSLEGLLANA